MLPSIFACPSKAVVASGSAGHRGAVGERDGDGAIGGLVVVGHRRRGAGAVEMDDAIVAEVEFDRVAERRMGRPNRAAWRSGRRGMAILLPAGRNLAQRAAGKRMASTLWGPA
jgi:hypothetical protein